VYLYSLIRTSTYSNAGAPVVYEEFYAAYTSKIAPKYYEYYTDGKVADTKRPLPDEFNKIISSWSDRGVLNSQKGGTHTYSTLRKAACKHLAHRSSMRSKSLNAIIAGNLARSAQQQTKNPISDGAWRDEILLGDLFVFLIRNHCGPTSEKGKFIYRVIRIYEASGNVDFEATDKPTDGVCGLIFDVPVLSLKKAQWLSGIQRGHGDQPQKSPQDKSVKAAPSSAPEGKVQAKKKQTTIAKDPMSLMINQHKEKAQEVLL
jgi:hypothetical protein